jgi:hypothetical protein
MVPASRWMPAGTARATLLPWRLPPRGERCRATRAPSMPTTCVSALSKVHAARSSMPVTLGRRSVGVHAVGTLSTASKDARDAGRAITA